MKLVIVAKNPYYYSGKSIKPYLSGHSTGFVQPFIDYLLARGHTITLISPKEEIKNPIEFSVFPKAPVSKKFHAMLIRPTPLPKVPFSFGGLHVQAALLKAQNIMGRIDGVLVVYVFPWIVPVNSLKEQLGFKTFAFLRGSDVFSGCAIDSLYSLYFENELWSYHREMIVKAINTSDKVFSVSELLKSYAQKEGIRVDMISPTPPFQIDGIEGNKISRRKQFMNLKIIFPALHDRWIFYLGRFHEEKRPELVLKVFRELSHRFSDITLIMAGLGKHLEALETLNKKFSMAKVNFCFIPPKYVALFCRCADIMIYPTTPDYCLDARPGACMNASYAGCPIVFPYKKSVLSNGVCESVSPINVDKLTVDPCNDEASLIQKMVEKTAMLLKDEKLYARISNANIAFTRKFVPHRIFSQIETAVTGEIRKQNYEIDNAQRMLTASIF